VDFVGELVGIFAVVVVGRTDFRQAYFVDELVSCLFRLWKGYACVCGSVEAEHIHYHYQWEVKDCRVCSVLGEDHAENGLDYGHGGGDGRGHAKWDRETRAAEMGG